MSREAMEQALAFVEFCWRDVLLNDYAEEQRAAVEAVLRAALAEQPAPQEPVAWYLPQGTDDSLFRDHRTVVACTGNKWEGWVPLYPARPAPPAPQEPVAWAITDHGNVIYLNDDRDESERERAKWGQRTGVALVPLYTTPPAPQPLTIERQRDALLEALKFYASMMGRRKSDNAPFYMTALDLDCGDKARAAIAAVEAARALVA